MAFSSQANYTDLATATCWRNSVPTFADRGVSRGQHDGSPTAVNLSFIDRSRYRNIKSTCLNMFHKMCYYVVSDNFCCSRCPEGRRDSAVGKTTDYRLERRRVGARIPVNERDSHSLFLLARSWVHRGFYPVGTERKRECGRRRTYIGYWQTTRKITPPNVSPPFSTFRDSVTWRSMPAVV
jgi:hypothetical protein